MFHSRLPLQSISGKPARINPRRIVLLAPFPSDPDRADASIAELLELLTSSGERVTAVSARAEDIARFRPRFRTRRHWTRTREALSAVLATPYDAVISIGGLAFDAIDKPRWRSRRMEEYRRLVLTYQIIKRSRNCALLLCESGSRAAPFWFTGLLMLVALRHPRKTRVFHRSPSAAQLATRLQRAALHPSNRGATQKGNRRTAPPDTVRIMGISEGQSGLARNTLMSIEALKIASIPCVGSVLPFQITPPVDSAAQRHQLCRPVTLHHINADRIPQQVRAAGKSYHIGFLLWELDSLPQSHLPAGTLLDEIWVPSTFVQDVYQQHYDRDVVNMRKGFSLPQVVPSDLSCYNLNARHYVFLMSFDANSSVERKNPLAAVRAFVLAFGSRQDVRIIIKTTPVGPSHWGDPNGQMQAIRRLAMKDERIILDDRMLPFAELLALIRRADCVVSPHRAEGFGYIPAYALWYGRPVIATDYSGTRDICSEDTAYPVEYNLISAREGETIEPVSGAHWADIDVNALADTMQQVYEDRKGAKLRAEAGQELLQTVYTPHMQAQRYLERFRALGLIG